MRLIDADALKDELLKKALVNQEIGYNEKRQQRDRMSDRFYGMASGLFSGITILNHQPTIEERKTGKWEYNTSSCGSVAFIHRKCSECGYENMGMGTKYCPDCGARMVNGDD